jgi:hypothetical protein
VFSESLVATQVDGAPSASSLLALALPGMLAIAALPTRSVWIRTR